MAANDDKKTNSGSGQKPQQGVMPDDEFLLEVQSPPLSETISKKAPAKKSVPSSSNTGQSAEVLSYRHDDKRTNNPHIDPALNFDSHRGQALRA